MVEPAALGIAAALVVIAAASATGTTDRPHFTGAGFGVLVLAFAALAGLRAALHQANGVWLMSFRPRHQFRRVVGALVVFFVVWPLALQAGQDDRWWLVALLASAVGALGIAWGYVERNWRTRALRAATADLDPEIQSDLRLRILATLSEVDCAELGALERVLGVSDVVLFEALVALASEAAVTPRIVISRKRWFGLTARARHQLAAELTAFHTRLADGPPG